MADKVVDLIYLKYLKAKITYEHDRRRDISFCAERHPRSDLQCHSS